MPDSQTTTNPANTSANTPIIDAIKNRFPKVGFDLATNNKPHPLCLAYFEIRSEAQSGQSVPSIIIDGLKIDFETDLPSTATAQQRQQISESLFDILRQTNATDEKSASESPDTQSIIDSVLASELGDGSTAAATGTVFEPIPGPFDNVKFTKPTAIIIKSSIPNLYFRPDPLRFVSNLDSVYYRDLWINEKTFRTCSFINAYENNKRPTDLLYKTPENQDHKIDFEMVLAQWGKHMPSNADMWLMTPIRIDPPFNNGGGG